MPAVAPASAGPNKETVRRRSDDAELWRTAFARLNQIRLFGLADFLAGVPAVAPASAGRRLMNNGPPPFGRRRTMADSLRPTNQMRLFELVGFLAGVPAVAPASAGRRLNRSQKTVRRRSDDAELWRTPFARRDRIRYSTLLTFWAGVPAVAPASAGRRLEARGVEPLFPACYIQQRPRSIYESHFRGEYALMDKRGRTWMYLAHHESSKC